MQTGTDQRLYQEMVVLFGRDTVNRALKADPADLGDIDAETVADNARQIRTAPTPQAQIREVAGLTARDRLLLAMWLLDAETPEKLINRRHH